MNNSIKFAEYLSYYNQNPDLVRQFKHPEFPNVPLIGFDYTPICQFSRTWNEYTSAARGLVFDIRNNKVVAKPFNKFMNLGEPGCDVTIDDLINNDFTAVEKCDGSFGIIFYNTYIGKWTIMTRGSFNSEQAQTAQSWIDSDVAQSELMQYDLSTVFMAEIIYPANRIVVDYGDTTGLILLGVSVNGKFTIGNRFDISKLTNVFLRSAKEYKFSNSTEMLDFIKKQDYNTEGVVIYLNDGRMCKIKSDDYCEVHKIKTNMTPKSIVENISDNYLTTGAIKADPALVAKLPNEFWKQIELWEKQILDVVLDNHVKLTNIVTEYLKSIEISDRASLMKNVQQTFNKDDVSLVISVIANSIKLNDNSTDDIANNVVIPVKVINSWILSMVDKLV